MDDKIDEEVFAQHKKRTEQIMKIVVTLFVAMLLFTLYFLLDDWASPEGISAQEAASSQYAAYQPAGAFNGLIGLISDIRLSDEYHLNCNVRCKWLGDAIHLSPVVSQGHLDMGYLSLSYRFK